MSKALLSSEEQSSLPLLLPHGSGGDVEEVTCCVKACATCLVRPDLKPSLSHCVAQGSYHLRLRCRGVKVPSRAWQAPLLGL